MFHLYDMKVYKDLEHTFLLLLQPVLNTVFCSFYLAKKMLESTGQEEITLSSLSSSDYSHLEELAALFFLYKSINFRYTVSASPK